MPWAKIKLRDDDQEVCMVHVMPVTEVKGFDTQQECTAFIERMAKEDFPCLINSDDEVFAVYFGHKLASDCICMPTTRDDDDVPVIIHNQFQ